MQGRPWAGVHVSLPTLSLVLLAAYLFQPLTMTRALLFGATDSK
jgi:hypothetical protein